MFCNDPSIATGTVGYTRLPDGSINQLLSVPSNRTIIEVEGYDLTLNYRLPETSWGRFSLTWDTTYMASVEFDRDGDNLVGEYFDQNNNWRIRSNLMTRWEKGDIGATWFMRFYSRQEESCPFYYNDYGFGELCNDAILGNGSAGGTDVVQEGSQNKIGGTTYHDLSAYWKAPWNATLTVGVNNAFDKNPPIAFTAFANSFDPQYDLQGRFFYLSYSQKF